MLLKILLKNWSLLMPDHTEMYLIVHLMNSLAESDQVA
jgi:hypothetical protein